MYKLSPDPRQLKILAPLLLCLYLNPSLFQPKIPYLPTILFLLGSSSCLSTLSLNALFFEPNVFSIDGDEVLFVRAMELISQHPFLYHWHTRSLMGMDLHSFLLAPNLAGGFLGVFNTTTSDFSWDQIEFDSDVNLDWDPFLHLSMWAIVATRILAATKYLRARLVLDSKSFSKSYTYSENFVCVLILEPFGIESENCF